MESDEKVIEKLNLHHVGSFQDSLISRKESIEETIELLKVEESYSKNINLFNRTTNLYRSTQEVLNPLRESMIRNSCFTHVEILHKSSSLGLPYQIFAKHKNGQEIFFDGLSYRIKTEIKQDKFKLNDINKLAGYPNREDNVVRDLESSLREVLPNLPEMTYSMYSFYTCYVGDWEMLGITNKGQAQLHLSVNDENIVTLTALKYSKVGKEYDLFIGDEKAILEMNSHHLFYIREYERFSNHIDHLRSKIEQASSCASDTMYDITKSFLKFVPKYNSWNKSKPQIRKMYSIKKKISKYNLLSETLQKIVKNNSATRNAPKQIWFEEEPDSEWMQSYWCSNFFHAELDNNEIKNLNSEPSKPLFSFSVDEVCNKVELLNKEVDRTINEIRDLLSAIQTEFSMYAVWLAIGAVIVSVLFGLISSSLQ
ncbi:hypothetical protein N480_03570 [Pseudoalteromonas luteoviolacea S2607]|uniref:hypothetical protein n=1 Tax=Pseudoalteromonas luteoviolacea TaxID=43657 RepID=UPI0007B07215|nr:hypothetical protein [Pseudoalteromonas luteoviolacea]KZN30036.1 hypothetical protein N480_03570 [Pseudoalteromonas luteoviolacea S2607]